MSGVPYIDERARRIIERIADAVTTMQREGTAVMHQMAEIIAKECVPHFEQLGMSNEGDGWGFDEDLFAPPAATDETYAFPAYRDFLPLADWDCRDEAVLLLVDYTDGDHAIDDAFIGITIGHNNDHNVGDDEGQGWLFAGWCWSHDHYVQGKGKPIGWMPIPHHLARAVEAAQEAAA